MLKPFRAVQGALAVCYGGNDCRAKPFSVSLAGRPFRDSVSAGHGTTLAVAS
jgi:hypothetical protein